MSGHVYVLEASICLCIRFYFGTIPTVWYCFHFIALFRNRTFQSIHIYYKAIYVSMAFVGRRIILPVSKVRTNKFHIFRQCTYTVY